MLFSRVLECHGPASLPVRPLDLAGVGVTCYCRRPLRSYGTSSHQSRCAIFLLSYSPCGKSAATVAGYHELIGEIPSSRLKEARMSSGLVAAVAQVQQVALAPTWAFRLPAPGSAGWLQACSYRARFLGRRMHKNWITADKCQIDGTASSHLSSISNESPLDVTIAPRP